MTHSKYEDLIAQVENQLPAGDRVVMFGRVLADYNFQSVKGFAYGCLIVLATFNVIGSADMCFGSPKPLPGLLLMVVFSALPLMLVISCVLVSRGLSSRAMQGPFYVLTSKNLLKVAKDQSEILFDRTQITEIKKSCWNTVELVVQNAKPFQMYLIQERREEAKKKE